MPATSPCSWTQERIEAYIDGELTPAEQGRLEDHAATCAACAAELEDARRLVGALRTLPSLTCPDAVSQALQTRIRQARGKREVRRWGWAYAAAAVLALIAGYHLFDPEPVPPAFSPQEITQARRQVEWTLAYLGDLNSRMGTRVRDDVIQPHLVQPLRLNLDTILPVQTM